MRERFTASFRTTTLPSPLAIPERCCGIAGWDLGICPGICPLRDLCALGFAGLEAASDGLEVRLQRLSGVAAPHCGVGCCNSGRSRPEVSESGSRRRRLWREAAMRQDEIDHKRAKLARPSGAGRLRRQGRRGLRPPQREAPQPRPSSCARPSTSCPCPRPASPRQRRFAGNTPAAACRRRRGQRLHPPRAQQPSRQPCLLWNTAQTRLITLVQNNDCGRKGGTYVGTNLATTSARKESAAHESPKHLAAIRIGS